MYFFARMLTSVDDFEENDKLVFVRLASVYYFKWTSTVVTLLVLRYLLVTYRVAALNHFNLMDVLSHVGPGLHTVEHYSSSGRIIER